MFRPLLPVLLFSAGICFSHIHQGHLAGDAVRYASIASNILIRSEWFSLYDGFQGIEGYANKPHLLFWLLAFCIKLFGYSTFVAKLPSAVFVFLSLILFFHIAQKLYQRNVAFVLLALFVCTRVFMRDILELNVEGISLLGALLCLLWALRRILDQPNGFMRDSPPLILGIVLILQSKTPFILLFLFPVIALRSLRREKLIKDQTKGSYQFITTIFVIGLLYLGVQNLDYLRVAFDNQWINPIRENDEFLYNIFAWLGVLAFSWAPISWFGIWRAAELTAQSVRSRSLAMINDVELLLLLWAAPIIPILLIVDCRPRYALFPMIGLSLLAGARLETFVSKFSYRLLSYVALTASLLCILLFAVLNIPIHRSNSTVLAVEILNKDPSLSGYSICIERNTVPRARRAAKFTNLLLELEFRSRFDAKTQIVHNKDTMPEPSLLPRSRVLADEECRSEFGSRGLKSKVLRTLPKGFALIEFTADTRPS